MSNMFKPGHVYRLIYILSLTVFLSACGSISETYDEVFPEKEKIDYKKAKQIDTLEVPPDMTSSTIDSDLVVPDLIPGSSANYSDYSRERSGINVVRGEAVLPSQQSLRMERDGKQRWLVVAGTPSQVWPKMREFWLEAGFLIRLENPRIAILETDWAENRADIASDFITDALSSLIGGLYSAATRDKYRVRLEVGSEENTTELYLTHYGAEEVIEGSTETTIWKPRPRDVELEVEMLRRMAVFFGVDEKRSRSMLARRGKSRTERARLSRSRGISALSLDDDFQRAWRRTGLALDRIGFTVEDRDRSRGLYFVRYVDPLKDSNQEKGWLDSIAFWSTKDEDPGKNKYQISLTDIESSGTRVIVLNDKGGPENSTTAYRILSLLHEQLK